MTSNESLTFHLKKCLGNNRRSQKYIFERYYSFAESLCEHYVFDYDELPSLVSECFLLVFKNIPVNIREVFPDEDAFYYWLRKWIICGIVDYSRMNFMHQQLLNFKHAPLHDTAVLWKRFFQKFFPMRDKQTAEEMDWVIHSLSASNRIVLNLIVLENFTSGELAKCLGVSHDTASGNISKLMEQIKRSISLCKKNKFCVAEEGFLQN